MVESERVTIRLPSERIEALQALVTQGKFSTISDAIRAAIDKFVEGEFTPEYIEKITVELPKGNVVNLKQLVQEGDSVSVDDACDLSGTGTSKLGLLGRASGWTHGRCGRKIFGRRDMGLARSVDQSHCLRDDCQR